ncbi:MAG: serine/threonine-protein kinase [Rubrobacteraceae bacterium]
MAETRYIEGQYRYELAEVVGRGGFGTVWRARASDGDDVAIKIIPVYSAGERSRALREGQIAEDLRHENIVETLEVIPGPHEVYLVTEYIEGQPLDEAAELYDADQIIDSLAQILEALAYAHEQGVIHRDIKPQNALVDERGTVKLTDFGVAYRPGDTRLTQVGFAVGTPGYIAPELIDSSAAPSALSDIYAVGATARTLLAHYPDEVPPLLSEFINRATSPNPVHRPQSAEEALYLLTGRRKPKKFKKSGKGESTVAARKHRTYGVNSDQVLRIINGLIAGWLGYLGAGLLLDGASAAGVAAGFGVLGYLLPRLAALGLLVALAVVLWRNGVGLGVTALSTVIGGIWVAAGGISPGLARLPLGPVLAVPLAATVIGAAGLPLLFGALMRPFGAALSAGAAALALVGYDLTYGDGVTDYLGLQLGTLPMNLGPEVLLQSGQTLFLSYPALLLQAALWASVAGLISLAEWLGRPIAGLVLASGCGGLGYILLVPQTQSLTQAMISLGVAAIIYGLIRYLGSRVRG